jgi:hypothetical protein
MGGYEFGLKPSNPNLQSETATEESSVMVSKTCSLLLAISVMTITRSGDRAYRECIEKSTEPRKPFLARGAEKCTVRQELLR